MAQNLISLSWTPEQLAELDASLAAAEGVLANLISLAGDEVRGLFKMGDKSESFCRGTVDVAIQNRRVIPESLDLDAALLDLAALDALRPRMRRLQQLAKRAEDTETLLGSDIFSAALEAYALLKVSGRNQGLEGLRAGLSSRFRNGTRKAPPVES